MDILRENGQISLTRVFAVLNYVLFVFGSLYLLLGAKTWGNYEIFAIITGGGGVCTQLGNKFINSRFNSPAGKGYMR